jgi:hypothetical protein
MNADASSQSVAALAADNAKPRAASATLMSPDVSAS